MSDWASVRLVGPPNMVAELLKRLGVAGIEWQHETPIPPGATEDVTWHAMARPTGWGSPAERSKRRKTTKPGAVGPCLVAGIDGLRLMLPGQDAGALWKRAVAWAEREGLVVVDAPEVVAVERIRAVDYCPPHCGCGLGVAHFVPSRASLKGAFLGVFVQVERLPSQAGKNVVG